MFCTKLICSLSAVLAILAPIQGSFAPQGRMSGGSSVETLRRFPHHVLIQERKNNYDQDCYQNEEISFCGGSIISQRGILTSASCVINFKLMEISFQRLLLTQTNGSYSAVVNRDAVHEYPTQFDDIAIIELPFSLIFSDTVKPVRLYKGPNVSGGQFVVMSGYDNSTSYNGQSTMPPSLNSDNQMTYGMFRILSNNDCANELDDELAFDKYLQYCSKPWSNTRNSPSVLDVGSGLITGWPAAPQLIGIYSYSLNNIAVYTNVAKYADWINGVTSGYIPA